ncbi:hypothetical protein M434DRAFT_394089 [Hypoxylon sp. CO27-5]|nr:hypothetical protein M434DRAFT_394089 [Hypoxylon sp. CO27-5]
MDPNELSHKLRKLKQSTYRDAYENHRRHVASAPSKETEENDCPRGTSNNKGGGRHVRWGTSEFYEISPRPSDTELPAAANDESSTPSSESSQGNNARRDHDDYPYVNLPRRYPEEFHQEPNPPQEEAYHPRRSNQVYWQPGVENSHDQGRRTPSDRTKKGHRRSRHDDGESQRPEKSKKQRREETDQYLQQNPWEPQEAWYGRKEPIVAKPRMVDPEAIRARWLGPASSSSPQDNVPQSRPGGVDDLHQEIDETIDWMHQQEDDDYNWHYQPRHSHLPRGSRNREGRHYESNVAPRVVTSPSTERFKTLRPLPRRSQSHPPHQLPRVPTPPPALSAYRSSGSHLERGASTPMYPRRASSSISTYSNGHDADTETFVRMRERRKRLSLADGLAMLDEEYSGRNRRHTDISSTIVEVHQDPPPRRRRPDRREKKKSIGRQFLEALGFT